jgi:hypothetical protein
MRDGDSDTDAQEAATTTQWTTVCPSCVADILQQRLKLMRAFAARTASATTTMKDGDSDADAQEAATTTQWTKVRPSCVAA